ncbi:MAG: biotin/lipoate A/B protein ligase family protein [bacterium]|nr:biotin/lipoate A/B protein ligase family protein [bacterium]
MTDDFHQLWRYIVHRASGGPTNMAVDEAVLIHCMEGVSPPTLRFYEWQKPSISIGYAMNAETEVNLPLCREREVPVVRRITGGGLVFHKCDITYTVVFPEDFNPGGNRKRLSVLESYRLVNQALAAGLGELGIVTSLLERERKPTDSRQKTANICFSNPTVYDILYEGRKLAGSAQRRKKGWVLHQGSMLFSSNFVTMCPLALPPRAGREASAEASKCAEGDSMQRTAVCLEQILGQKPERGHILSVLSENFARALGIELEPRELSASELETAERLREEKYSTDDWNLHRIAPLAS